MTFEDYEAIAETTIVYPEPNSPYGLFYCAISLCGEVGELANKVKKVMRGDFDFTEQFKLDIQKELGDILWYLTMLARESGSNLNDIAWLNIEKLRKRKEEDKIKGEGDSR